MSTAKAEPAPEPEPAAEVPLPEGARIESVGDPSVPHSLWRRISYGTWQISVSPDGLLQLPKHLHPREWADFVAAGSIAAGVAAKVVADNAARATRDSRALALGNAIVREGPGRRSVPGALPMVVTPGANPPPRKSAIGRPRNTRRPVAPPGAMI